MKRKNIPAKIMAGALLCSVLAGCGNASGSSDAGEDHSEEMSVGSTVNPELDDESTSEAVGQSENAAMEGSDALSDAYKRAQKFSKDLFGESIDGENPVLSPVSAYMALSLAAEGAKEETAEEFDEILGNERAQICKDLMNRLPSDDTEIKIKLANSVWLDEELTPDETWMAGAKDIFLSDVVQTKLSAAKTKNEINQWVELNTAGLIRQFLTEPLEEDTRLALFNTIYFKGKWEHAFEASDTYDRTFTLGDQKTVINVPTMNLYRESLLYVKSDFCEGIVLPYKDTELVFAALKPSDAVSDVRGLYEKLAPEEIGHLVDTAVETDVNLHLPKFEVTFDRKLNEDLIHMGLERAFREELANFSGLGKTQNGEPLYIGLVRQKAVFILDEEGTEAAAATQVTMLGATMAINEEQPLEVDFNEPFLYTVYDKESGLCLFIGIMDNPAT